MARDEDVLQGSRPFRAVRQSTQRPSLLPAPGVSSRLRLRRAFTFPLRMRARRVRPPCGLSRGAGARHVHWSSVCSPIAPVIFRDCPDGHARAARVRLCDTSTCRMEILSTEELSHDVGSGGSTLHMASPSGHDSPPRDPLPHEAPAPLTPLTPPRGCSLGPPRTCAHALSPGLPPGRRRDTRASRWCRSLRH
jgi:hypothetical protein